MQIIYRFIHEQKVNPLIEIEINLYLHPFMIILYLPLTNALALFFVIGNIEIEYKD
jgi:hypothetical protein